MLLPLLGACAVVGPFQGPEWEPVRGLLAQDCSCKDPRCCGNLLVLCLFLIWQIRHCWHCIVRTRSCKRNATKVRPKKRAMPSERHDTSFGMPSRFFHPDKLKDTHVQQLAEKQRSLQKAWVQSLLSPQQPCQDPPWDVHTLSESIFYTSSFASACLLPQDSSSEAERIPWSLRDCETHLRLHTCRQVRKLLVHSQEKRVPAEPAGSLRYPTAMTLAMSLPNLSAQRLPFFHRAFLPDPPNLQQEMPTWMSSNSPQENEVPQSETQVLGRENSGETQAPWGVNQRESPGEDACGIQESRGQLFGGSRRKDGVVAKALGYKSLKTLTNKMDGKIWTPVWENQDHGGVETRTPIAERGKKNQKEVEDKKVTQAHLGENQEGVRWQTDAETQTPEWENQGKTGSEEVVEILLFETKETRKEGKGEIPLQGCTGGENEKSQMPQQDTRDQAGIDTGAETEAEERRNQDQAGSAGAVQTQTSERENVGETKQDDDDDDDDDAGAQALEWGKQGYIGIEKIQTPVGEKRGHSGNEKARDTHKVSKEEQKLSRHAVHGGRDKASLGRDREAEKCQISRRKKHREIRQEDWVVIQAAWWGNQRLIASEIHREFDIPHWGTQMQFGGEFRAEIQVPENDRRKGGDKDGTYILAPEAKNQGHLRCKTDMDNHPAERKSKIRDENGIDFQSLDERNLRKVKGEDGPDTWELGQEYLGQLRNKFHPKIHILKWKSQEHIKGKDDEDTLTLEAEKWGELMSNSGGEIHSSEGKKAEQVGSENDAETHIQIPREAGVEDATEVREAGEGSQSQLGCNRDDYTHWSEWKNKPIGIKDGTEKRNQREPGGEDDVKKEGHRQLESERGSCSPGRKSWELPGTENPAEKQASTRRGQRRARGEDGRKRQSFKRKKQRLIRSKVNRKICSVKRKKNQVQIRGRNGAEIETQGKRNVRKTTDDGGTDTQIPVEDDQEQESQTRGHENQKKGEFEDAGEIQDVRNQRKGRREGPGGSGIPRSGDNKQVRGKEARRTSLQGDCSANDVPSGRMHSLAHSPTPVASRYETLKHRQTVTVNSVISAPHSEMEHKAGVPSMAGLRSQRRQPRNPSSHAWQSQNPQSSALSTCPPPPCGQAPQDATALVGASTALHVIPTWPSLRKSKRLLLESLMRRRIAHLRWGLPWRILESYLLFNYSRPCSLPVAEVRLPGLCTNQELQRHGGIQSSMSGLKSPERSQSLPPPERKSAKLPTQAKPLGTCRPLRSESVGSAIPPVKPRRTKPPGGAREPQVQEEAAKSKVLAPRNPRSASESRSRCGPVRVLDLSNEILRGREMIGTGVSLMAEGASSRVRISSSRADQDYWKEERRSWGSPEPFRPQSWSSTYHRRGSLEAVKGRGPGGQLSFCSMETSSLEGNVHPVVARTSMSLPSNISWSPPQLAKAQHSAPNLTLRNPMLLPQGGDPHSREDIIGIQMALERDSQPPGYFCAGVAFPQTEHNKDGETAEKINWGPRNPPAPRKLGFIKRLKCFIFQCGLKK
ncbi:PREDICTED: uncharacterized protein C22orf46 homolog [Dipodomys ordii]|uniref:Uncharacterized protein C22orf46 homolog n=1 Tax=Dipodomys ordii TaxID=10020 RepID=A0A1S3FV27_DIPOR|nr:PREDICTED: uncharacterized protein C22orf46 homolog [Dipodomys ordii]